MTDMTVVPPIAVFLAKHPVVDQFDLTCVNHVLCGAAPLSAELEKEIIKILKGPKVRCSQGALHYLLVFIYKCVSL